MRSFPMLATNVLPLPSDVSQRRDGSGAQVREQLKRRSSAAAAILLTIGLGLLTAPAIAMDKTFDPGRSPAQAPDLTKTAMFPHVAMTGVTKPAGAALDERAGTSPALTHRNRQLSRLIQSSICRGCR